MSVTANDAGKDLNSLIQQVDDDRAAVEILGHSVSAVLLSKDEFDAMEATAHPLRSPANAAHLLESLAQARR